ncbi:hypothetical protein [Microbacterium sp.]|uniref:hypothetical protein n=1 Tax=Microbacterium sp. TaxID=51671 RepID=UPI001AC5CB07|nr:hypothetical protein [Microbacterium sp.]MBN9224332.1 hypothetical protein [Microbacterium sp.]
MGAEERILQELASSWVSLAAEYAEKAAGVTAYYIYGSSEHGASTANAYFEQDGVVVFPGALVGADRSLVRSMMSTLVSDMKDAGAAFVAAGLAAPTEYRLEYRVEGGKLDLQLEFEQLYGPGLRDRSPIVGIEYWLGDRAPKLIRGS